MIAAWMLYTIIISAVLALAAGALDFIARTVGAPTRWVWAGAIVGTLGLSLNALARPAPTLAPVSHAVDTTVAMRPRAAAAATITVRAEPPTPRSAIADAMFRLRTRLDDAVDPLRRIDVAPLDPWNDRLVAIWFGSAALGMLFLVGTALRMRVMRRTFTPRRLDDRRVLVSDRIGPALLGVLRPTIVVPAWVLELSPKDRNVILTHEEQHRRAGDPLLLLGCSIAVATQIWNPVLWLIAARVRLAIEMDCDRRVLAEAGDDVRHYGELLIRVHERVSVPTATLALVARPSTLERRIRRMTSRSPRLVSFGGIVAACAAFVLAAAAWIAPAPSQHTSPIRSVAARDTSAKQVVRRALGLSATVCGFGATSGAHCSVEGEVLINRVDSLRMVVAVRERDAAGTPVEHSFYLTAVEPLPARLSRYIADAHVEYIGGDLSIVDRAAPRPALIFSAGRRLALVPDHDAGGFKVMFP